MYNTIKIIIILEIFINRECIFIQKSIPCIIGHNPMADMTRECIELKIKIKVDAVYMMIKQVHSSNWSWNCSSTGKLRSLKPNFYVEEQLRAIAHMKSIPAPTLIQCQIDSSILNTFFQIIRSKFQIIHNNAMKLTYFPLSVFRLIA